MATKPTKSTGSSRAAENHEVIDKTADKLHESVDKLADGARQVDDKVRDQARRTEEKLSTAVDDVREHSEQLIGQTTGFIKANPLLSMGLAVVAGIVLDRIMRR